jgi:hypothetical protein
MEPHPHSTACDISDRLQYIDALGESLEKIQALTRMLILGCSSFGESDNDSHTLQWVLTAILEHVDSANHSWKTLESMR